MTGCTWNGCTAEAQHPIRSEDQGDIYAKLCDPHKTEFDKVVADVGQTKHERLKRVWVEMQGGWSAARRRLMQRSLYKMGMRT